MPETSLIYLFLIVVGWAILILDNSRRSRRTEIRALIGDAINITEELEKASHGYWMKDNAEPEAPFLAAEIKRGITRLVRIVNALKRHNQAFELDDKIKLFRQSMTLGDFETAKRVPVASTDSRIRDITQAAFDLTEQLEITFESLYCSSWWDRFNR
jgi:hypothetical protein